MTPYNPNVDLVNINAYEKLGLIPSISSQDIERKQNFDNTNGHNAVVFFFFRKLTSVNPYLDLEMIKLRHSFRSYWAETKFQK